MRFVVLTPNFYSKHAAEKEILQKTNRPYVVMLLKIMGLDFGIPFRSNIQHPHAFLTDKQNNYGLDYSKAVVLDAANDIGRNATIRSHEYKILLGKDYILKTGLENYIKQYKKAVLNPDEPHEKALLKFSALKYFHKELCLPD